MTKLIKVANATPKCIDCKVHMRGRITEGKTYYDCPICHATYMLEDEILEDKEE